MGFKEFCELVGFVVICLAATFGVIAFIVVAFYGAHTISEVKKYNTCIEVKQEQKCSKEFINKVSEWSRK